MASSEIRVPKETESDGDWVTISLDMEKAEGLWHGVRTA